MANKVTRVKTEILESFDKDGNKIYENKFLFSDGTKCSILRKLDKKIMKSITKHQKVIGRDLNMMITEI